MGFVSTAAVPTTHGSRYLPQLCQHRSRNMGLRTGVAPWRLPSLWLLGTMAALVAAGFAQGAYP